MCAGGALGVPAAVRAASVDYPQRSTVVARSFQAASGVQVTQITDFRFGNQLSYYDIPCYAPSIERLVYNTVVSVPPGKSPKKNKPNKDSGYLNGAVWGVVSCRLDGSDPRLLVTRLPATSSTVRIDMSQDGKLVTYTRFNDAPDSGWDLYGFRPGVGRQVEEFRITQLRTLAESTNRVKTSPAAWDARAAKYLCSFSIDDTVWLVYDDGKGPGGNRGPTSAPLTDLADFPERRQSETSFHRIRLNPAFANLLYYRRNGVRDNWAVDLFAPAPKSRRITDYQASIHATWTPDGRILAGSMKGPWMEWTVADSDGRLLSQIASRGMGSFGRNGRPGIFYGCYSNDGQRLAVATRYDQEPGGSLWLMNRETGKAAYLCKTRYFGPVVAGQPRLGFIDHDRAIVFSSDNSVGRSASQPPQIFLVRPLPQV